MDSDSQRVPRIKYVAWIVTAVLVAILVGWYLSFSNTRYYLIQNKDGSVYKIDRGTGRTWQLHGTTKSEVVSSGRGEVMPADLQSRVRIEGLSADTQSVRLSNIYNGSNWHVTEMTLTIDFPKIGRRKYRATCDIPPFSTRYVEIRVGSSALAGAVYGDWKSGFKVEEIRGRPNGS